MSRDILAEATRALKDDTAPRTDDVSLAAERRRARETRDRLINDLRRPDTRRRRRLLLVPLAAILIGSTAWASGAIPAAWHALTGSDDASQRRVAAIDAPAPSALLPAAHAPVASSGEQSEQEQEMPPDEPTQDAAPEVDAVPHVAALPTVAAGPDAALADAAVPSPAAVPAPKAAAEPVADDATVVDPATALYRSAHQAHFAEGNPGVALQRWNAYLAAAPTGRFAPEASYNRALCLVRLGQHGAAMAALAPFVSGSYGAYRQAEAKRIVEALQAKQ